MNGWHEAWDDMQGAAVVCGHLPTITVPPVAAQPPEACRECLIEGTQWIELRKCLICGHNGCCESSPQRHATHHFEQTGHALTASQTRGDTWGWCYADELALLQDHVPA